MFIYDILLGPHFVTHVPWAGTFLKDYVLHIIYDIYSATHIYDIYSVTCICVIYCTTWWTYTYSTNCWTVLDDWNIPAYYVGDGFDDFLVDWYAHVIFAAVSTRWIWIWHILSRLCVYIRVSFAGLNNDILDAIYGRWHGLCLYCAWFIYRCTCWHAVMIFNVVIHLSWCVISLTIWTSYWINGIHLLSCPHGQGSSQKRGSNF